MWTIVQIKLNWARMCPIEFRIIYFKIRYWYYFFGNTQVRCCNYGHSLLDKRPYLVTGLTAREVRTGRILWRSAAYYHTGACVTWSRGQQWAMLGPSSMWGAAPSWRPSSTSGSGLPMLQERCRYLFAGTSKKKKVNPVICTLLDTSVLVPRY